MHAPRILIVDDEQHILQVLSYTLSRQGYDIVTARDGDAAWHEAQRHQPDLIITDLTMPGINGMELANRVQEQAGEKLLPVMIVTGRQLIPEADSGGNVAAVLPKPFSPKQVIALVDELIGPAPAIQETAR